MQECAYKTGVIATMRQSASVMQQLLCTTDSPLELPWQELLDAALVVCKRHACDHYGLSVGTILFFIQCVFVQTASQLIASMSSFAIFCEMTVLSAYICEVTVLSAFTWCRDAALTYTGT